MPPKRKGQANCNTGWKSGKLRLGRRDDKCLILRWVRARRTKSICVLFFFFFVSHQKFVLFGNELSKNSPGWACFACNFPLCKISLLKAFIKELPYQISCLSSKKQTQSIHCQACLMAETTQRRSLCLQTCLGGWGEQSVLLNFVWRL